MDFKKQYRFFLSVFFFLSGFCFSTWASRIPTIKAFFGFNDAQLGTILLAMPVSSFIGLPLSGWLVSKFDSRIPLTAAFILNALALACIGFASSTWTLVISIGLFSFSLRILNISINTQSLTLQNLYKRKINGSFHGLWSTGGIVGIGFTTLMVAYKIPISWHLSIVSTVSFILTLVSFKYLIKNDKASKGNSISIGKPDPYIFYLGLLVFFAAVCEGGMFDWSGIYFRDEIKEEIFTVGYLTFMVCMALSRFISDRIIEKIGMRYTYFLSAALITSGIILALIFNKYWPAMIGFSLVGLGTGSIIPLTYSLAGKSSTYSAGIAISIIATYGIIGMLLGPPMIGYLSHAFGLRISFLAFALSGSMIIPVSNLFFRHLKRMEAGGSEK